MNLRSLALASAVLASGAAVAQTYPDACWPLRPIPPANAYWQTPTLPSWEMRITTTNPLEPDPQWAHIHDQPVANDDQSTVTITWEAFQGPTDGRSELEVRYTVDGIPVSPWLPSPGAPAHDFAFTIHVCQFLPNPPGSCPSPHVLGSFPDDGVFDLSCEVRWAATSSRAASELNEYFPVPAYLHVNRKNQSLYAIRQDSPLTNSAVLPSYARRVYGPIVDRVSPSQRSSQSHPLDPTVTRASIASFSAAPMHAQADYFVDRLTPHSDLFSPYFLWWKHNATSPFPPFARALTIGHESDARGLLKFTSDSPADHRKFPAIDGPRGTALMTGYVGGQVDSVGNFYFAETSGRIARIAPDGEILTLSGFRVAPGEDPIWWQKSRSVVHDLQNVEFRGSWPTSVPYGGSNARQYPGMRLPLDVAIDADDPNVLYVAAFYDHCIYRVDATDPDNAVVTVLAGDPNTTILGSQQQPRGGFRDGASNVALFDGPCSLVFDGARDVLYVADQNNHAIREVDRQGNVTTLFGGRTDLHPVNGPYVPSGTAPTNPSPLFTPSSYFDSYAARTSTGADFEVTTVQAQGGTRPDVFLPQTVRIDSQGRLLVNEIGFGSIRRIVVDPNDTAFATTEAIADVYQTHTSASRGWAWFDVDRYGAIGPVDTIYFGSFNTGSPPVPNSVTNETWLWSPPNGGSLVSVSAGGQSYQVREAWPIFGVSGGAPVGLGRLANADGGHYPWVVAVDPRGALLTGGVGEFGLNRIRLATSAELAEFPSSASHSNYVDYRQGRQLVLQGGTSATPSGCTSPYITWLASVEMALGFDGHGLLGISDAWNHPTQDPSITAATRRTTLPSAFISSLATSELTQVDRFLRWSAWDVAPTPVPLPQTTFYVVGDGTTVLGTVTDGQSTTVTLGSTATLDFGVSVPRAAASTVVDFDIVISGVTYSMSVDNVPLLDTNGAPLALPDGSLVYHLLPASIPVSGGGSVTYDFVTRAHASVSIPGVSGELDETTVTVHFQ